MMEKTQMFISGGCPVHVTYAEPVESLVLNTVKLALATAMVFVFYYR